MAVHDINEPTGLVYLGVDQIHPHPNNPRKELGDLTELADSIRANGVLQNLTVVCGHWITPEEWSELSAAYKERPSEELRRQMNSKWLEDGYTAIIGHRRLAAAKLAGLEAVPCIVARMDDREQVATMLLENMQRSDLTVYEQAQGFQMMINMGETVKTVSDKTGFSTTTVYRRLKMAELDQQTLKEVSDRQISIGDFDKLAKIDDPKRRNECLKEIGTGSFNQTVQTAIRRQSIGKNLPLVKSALKSAKVCKMKDSDHWNGKFEQVGSEIDLAKWQPGDALIPQGGKRALLYWVDEHFGKLRFYAERKRAKPVKRSQAEIDREKCIAEAWARANELAAVAYKLRSDFVSGLSVTGKNQGDLLRGAAMAVIIKVAEYTLKK